MWVKRELSFALRQTRFDGRIIPILYQPCEPHLLSWALPSMQTVDFTQSFDDGCAQLLRVWGIGYRKEDEKFNLCQHLPQFSLLTTTATRSSRSIARRNSTV